MRIKYKIDWSQRLKTREKFKAAGFVSQYTVAKMYPHLNLKKVRRRLEDTDKIDLIQLYTSGTVSYWYREDLDFSYMMDEAFRGEWRGKRVISSYKLAVMLGQGHVICDIKDATHVCCVKKDTEGYEIYIRNRHLTGEK